jgi:phage terminase large subunit GpA-like protein
MQTRLNDYQLIKLLYESAPIEPPPRFISDYIEGKRIMPSNTPIPGPWENWRTAFGTEIMDCLSPWNPTQHVDVMSAAQVVKTSLQENTIGYYIGACPAPILFMSGTDSLLKKWATKRLEPLIDSLGLRDRMIAPVENEKSRRTGDTTFQKLFNGGFLEMASAQSPSSMRSDSVRVLCIDEPDAAPPLLNTGEGYFDEVVEARTSAWGNRRKILATSTPTEEGISTIYRRFKMGDQAEYFVPCPLCGKLQLLERGEEKGNHGLRAETKNGKIEFIYYLCAYCHDAIFEYQKPDMIRGGKWESKTTPERLRRSFHINALLSPMGMYSWIDYWSDYKKAHRSVDGMRSFINLRDGLIFKDAGSRPKISFLLENQGKHRAKEVLDGVLYITAGIDVQRGSKSDPDNSPRLEMHVIGIGAGYKMWSIEYKIFEGAIDDPYAGAWEDLYQYGMETELTYIRKSDGFKFPTSLILVDSGDGEHTSEVYRFCSRWTNTFPCKGFKAIQRRKREKGDELSESDFKRYRAAKVGEDITLYEVSTNYYKRNIYTNLYIKRLPKYPQANGFLDFPSDYGEIFFEQLTAEEKMTDGSFEAHGRRNEALDTTVYGLAAADIFLDSEVLNYRAWAKSQKFPFKSFGIDFRVQSDIMQITHRTILEEMINQTKIKT